MFKSKLQELCHRHSWNLPEYATVKDGPDHNAHFMATVTVNGVAFQTPPHQCRSSKEAQNHAAKLAFDHFTSPQFVLPQPPSTSSPSVEINDMFKSKLQELCHRHSWNLPEYTMVKEGPAHNAHFMATVTVNGVVFQTPRDQFRSSKEAQNHAAKLAFDHFSSPQFVLPHVPKPNSIASLPTSSSSGMYKSKLQELCHQYSWNLPEYTTVKDGPDHNARFTTTVTVNGVSFQTPPDQCRSSKVAQNLAAKLAFDHFTAPKIILQHSPNPTSHSNASATSSSSGFPAKNNQVDTGPARGLMTQSSQRENVQTLQNNATPPGLKDDMKAKDFPTLNNHFDIGHTRGLMMQSPQQVNVQTPQSNATPLSVEDDMKAKGFPTLNNHFDIGHKRGLMIQLPQQENVQTLQTNATSLSVEHDMKAKAMNNQFDAVPARGLMTQSSQQENVQTLQTNTTPPGLKDDVKAKGTLHLYKNRLQNYAQKKTLPLPTYTCDSDGPPHARRFKSKVTIDGKTYETADYFSSSKDAENAAAKVAFESLPPDETHEDEGLYKILLQELSKREGSRFPTYDTTKSGPPHAPTFVSSVEVGGEFFQGYEAKSKKQAEINAAKAAYTSLTERRESQNPTVLFPAPDIKSPFEVPSYNLQSGVPHEPNVTHQQQLDISPQPNFLIKAEQDKQDKDVLPYNQMMAPFPSISSPPKVGAESSPLERYPTNPVSKSTNETLANGTCTLAPNKVLVRPRRPNMIHPPGTTVLPYSDHRWVAVKKAGTDQNQ